MNWSYFFFSREYTDYIHIIQIFITKILSLSLLFSFPGYLGFQMNSRKTPKSREKTDHGESHKKVWKADICLQTCVPMHSASNQSPQWVPS